MLPKLGCLPSAPRDLCRAVYLPQYMQAVPDGPATCQRTAGFAKWGMKMNSTYGCCTVASSVHNKQAASYCESPDKINDISDQELVRVYLSLSPYDRGLNIGEFLKWQSKQAQPWKLNGYGVTDPRNPAELKKAIWWLGGLSLGIGVPSRWMNTGTTNGFVWEPVGRFNGVVHCVLATDYDERGLTIITWGARGTITWAGLAEQCGEAWCLLPPDWNVDGKSPSGLDVNGLENYLAYITGQNPPHPEPVPVPTPPPIPDPPPAPPVPPAPSPCALASRGMNVLRRAMDLGPDDPRVATALDWTEAYLK